jgi:hypothetical protein
MKWRRVSIRFSRDAGQNWIHRTRACLPFRRRTLSFASGGNAQAMRAIITHQPSCEVTRIERLIDQIVFHLASGQSLRAGLAPRVLEMRLKIDLSQPPSSLPTDIFCSPFMSRSVWNVVAPIVRNHPDIRRAFDGHPNLQALTQLGYEELRQLPLQAYITHGLYLSYPFNCVNRATDARKIDETTEYLCDFRDGDYLVKVVIDLQSRAVNVTQ